MVNTLYIAPHLHFGKINAALRRCRTRTNINTSIHSHTLNKALRGWRVCVCGEVGESGVMEAGGHHKEQQRGRQMALRLARLRQTKLGRILH